MTSNGNRLVSSKSRACASLDTGTVILGGITCDMIDGDVVEDIPSVTRFETEFHSPDTSEDVLYDDILVNDILNSSSGFELNE
jgi:hypothetical protein